MAVELESLELEITSSADQAVAGIDRLSAALSGLRTASEGGAGLRAVANQTAKISSALSSLPQGASTQLGQLRAALETLSEGEYGNAGLNNTARQLQKVNEAVAGVNLDPAKLEQLRTLREALAGLSSIEKASGLSSVLSALGKIPELTEQLDKVDFDAFTDKIRRAADALEPLASQMDRVSRGFAAFPIRIQKVIASNEGLASSNRKTAKSYDALHKASSAVNLAAFTGGLKLLSRLMGDWVTQSNAYVENLNLFTVAMGDAAQEAYDYAQTVKQAVGIDPSDWMRNQGVFKQIASGFGVAEDKAVLMSKNLTQLGYDISSFFNIGVEEAMQKVQSGISGELEPLRRLGYALDQATLKEVARSEGITKSFNAMTQAEKSQLRYIAMLRQSNNVMGDMARTAITPANALRILQQQIQQLTRALGNLLIPFLLRLIPIVQAVVEVLTELINKLASLVGFTLPQIDYSGLGGAAGAAGEVEEGLEGATKAAKELSAALGIDELNVIAPPSAGAGAGAGVEEGIFDGLELEGYDFLKDLSDQTKDLKDQMRELLYNFVLPIAAGLAAWKIAGLLEGMGGVMKGMPALLARLKQVAGVILAAWGAVKLLRSGWDAFENGLTGGNLLEMLAGAAALTIGLGVAFGSAGAAIGAAAAGVVLFTVGLKDLLQNGLNAKNLAAFAGFAAAVLAVGKVFGGPIAVAVGAASIAIGAFVNALDLARETVYVDVHSMDQVFQLLAVSAAGVGVALGVAFGPIPAVIGAVVTAAAGFYAVMQTDALPAIEIFDDTISQATREAVEPFLEKTRELSTSLKTLEFSGQIIDDAVIAQTKTQVDEIVKTITDAFDASKNEKLAALDPLAAYMDDAAYQNVLTKTNAYYDGLKTSVTAGQKEIEQILREAQSNNGVVTEEGWTRINEIQQQLQQVGVQTLSESQVEYETIMRNLKDNSSRISLEQASEIIKNAKAAHTETVAEAEKQYSEIVLQAQQLKEAGIINQTEYDAMKKAAEAARESTINDADAQYEGILLAAQENLGELSRYIDTNTGEIKTKWDLFWEAAGIDWDGFFDRIALGAGEFFGGLIRDAVQAYTDFKTKFIDPIGDAITGLLEKMGLVKGEVKSAQDAVSGVKEGFAQAAGGWAAGMISEARNELDINSPSGEFEEIGNYCAEGYGKGLSNAHAATEVFERELGLLGESQKSMVSNALDAFLSSLSSAQANNQRATDNMTSNYRTMASRSNAAIDSIISKLNSIPRNITTVHTIVTEYAGGGSNLPSKTSSAAKAAAFATGGFPTAGQLFLAREPGAGPELVGTMGSRTAVANNDQIVDGIAAGVADANAEQNAILREQNELLRAILSKDTSVTIGGRDLKRAYDAAARQSGASILTGGVFG